MSAAFPLGRVVPAEGGRAGRGAGAGGPASPAGAGAGPLRRAGIAAPGGSRGRTAAGRGLSRPRDGARRGVGPAAGWVLGAPARCRPAPGGGAAGGEGRARRGKGGADARRGERVWLWGLPSPLLGVLFPPPPRAWSFQSAWGPSRIRLRVCARGACALARRGQRALACLL